MVRVGLVVGLCALALAGCQTTEANPYDPPKPLEQMTRAEWCTYSMKLLGNPRGATFQKAALYEKMRNEGCLGQQQPTRVEVKQQ
jgi:hypothetical protein